MLFYFTELFILCEKYRTQTPSLSLALLAPKQNPVVGFIHASLQTWLLFGYLEIPWNGWIMSDPCWASQASVWPPQKVELRLLCTRQMDTQTERQHTDEELSAQRRNHHIWMASNPRVLLKICNWSWMAANWLHPREGLIVPCTNWANVVAFWQLWVGFTSRSRHLAPCPKSHNNTETLQESGGPLCLCIRLGGQGCHVCL